MKKKISALYDPARPLRGKSLRKTVNKLVNMQVKPALSAIDRQTGDEERRAANVQDRLKSYLDQLAQRQASLVSRAGESSAAGNAAQTAIADRTRAALTSASRDAQQSQAADAAVRGDIANAGNPQQQLAQKFAEQVASSAQRAGTDASRAATYNSSGEHLIQGLAGASGMRGGEQMTDVANRFAQTFRDLASKKTDILEKAGGLRADVATKLRQQEFNNLITREGLGIKQADLEASAMRLAETGRHNRRMESNARRATDVTRQNNVDNNVSSNLRALVKSGEKGKGPGGSFTPAQRERFKQNSMDFWDRVEDASKNEVALIKSAIEQNNAAAKDDDSLTVVPWNEATLRAALKKRNYKPYEINAIIDMLPTRNNGKLSPQMVKALKKRHISVPKKRRVTHAEGVANNVGSILGSLFG